MKPVDVLPWLAAAGVVAFMLITALDKSAFRRPACVLPAFLSVLFFAWSASAMIIEGPLNFWAEHTRNMWGNQIWFDLLLAVGIGWFLIGPRAKAVGMNILPWLFLIVCTGSIGFLMMAARLLYLEEKGRGSGVVRAQP
jgi:hypothetical protein